jgi:hypothetical protein
MQDVTGDVSSIWSTNIALCFLRLQNSRQWVACGFRGWQSWSSEAVGLLLCFVGSAACSINGRVALVSPAGEA